MQGNNEGQGTSASEEIILQWYTAWGLISKWWNGSGKLIWPRNQNS